MCAMYKTMQYKKKNIPTSRLFRFKNDNGECSHFDFPKNILHPLLLRLKRVTGKTRMRMEENKGSYREMVEGKSIGKQ